ncbi:hypothetical protein RFI_34375 [Reticulomyxa filosa]|uniref:Uncharacterized protein n=1 Tax=Reticulomyxa filosa TaxID=46433 RepID=X6LQL3_RETFI|nr:hypothetical protein RFI_34375 [Reticulomyxa filosa]|eukprot:ETO03035.1 hypothetical protein RFI_34375 [Reticulomyxa filosa]
MDLMKLQMKFKQILIYNYGCKLYFKSKLFHNHDKPTQYKLNNDKWDEMTLSKWYETLLKSYMKWKWMKSNGLNNKLNDNKIFKIFEMEMDYYLKLCGEIKMWTTNHSCEIQQRVLNTINNKFHMKIYQ